jgi:hypothetical protein
MNPHTTSTLKPLPFKITKTPLINQKMYLLVTSDLIAGMGVTDPDTSRWTAAQYMVNLIRNDLGLVLRPAPPAMAKIINGKLWVRLDGSDDEIKRVFGLRKAPGRPTGFSCIIPDWPSEFWDITLICNSGKAGKYEDIYDDLVNVIGVKQILAIVRLREHASSEAQVQLQVHVALDRDFKLLHPEFARVLVGFTIGDSVRKTQDSMQKKDDSSVRRWAPIPTDEDASSIPAASLILPGSSVPVAAFSVSRKRQLSAEVIEAAKRTYRKGKSILKKGSSIDFVPARMSSTEFVPARITRFLDEVQRFSPPPVVEDSDGAAEDARVAVSDVAAAEYVANESVVFHLDAMKAIVQETNDTIKEMHDTISKALERERSMLGIHQRAIDNLTKASRF